MCQNNLLIYQNVNFHLYLYLLVILHNKPLQNSVAYNNQYLFLVHVSVIWLGSQWSRPDFTWFGSRSWIGLHLPYISLIDSEVQESTSNYKSTFQAQPWLCPLTSHWTKQVIWQGPTSTGKGRRHLLWEGKGISSTVFLFLHFSISRRYSDPWRITA